LCDTGILIDHYCYQPKLLSWEMFETLFDHIERKVLLTQQEKVLMESFFLSKKLHRKEVLLLQSEHCKHLAFVVKGLLKTYNLDDKGNEHINLFAWEGWWASDMLSFFTGKPANFNIDAIEDTDILMISLANYNSLLEKIPAMERYFRILYQNSLLTKDIRLMSASTHTAEEKYLALAHSHPDLIQRVPQNLIASYLGLAPETISRIKRKIKRNPAQ